MNTMATMGPVANRSDANTLASRAGLDYGLDPGFCWQAAHSRDRRFDGLIFAGIVTTGVYCRSICPVSFGHPTNVRWFRSAAAAETAGFRPCKRCRPDTSPGSSAWSGTLAVVSNALKLISQGALDRGRLEELAESVGMGSRHLRRLFQQHLGVSPLKIARTQRVRVARDLICETRLAFTEIASRTGFKSVRQFNHSVQAAFVQSPTELRLQRDSSKRAKSDSGIVVHLPYRAPFDWTSLIEFFKATATPGVEAVDDNCYRRTIEIDGRAGTIEIWQEARRARLSMRVIGPDCDCLIRIVQRVRRMFDLEADAFQIERHLSKDARLAKIMAERPGLRVPGAWDGFEIAVRAVLGQRLTSVDAPTLAERIVRKFGQPVETSIHGLSHLFPRPEILAKANLGKLGVPHDRAETICSLAEAAVAGKLTFHAGKGLRNSLPLLQVHAGLKQGVASYIAMRSYGEPDAFPHTDPGLRKGFSIHGKPISPAELLRAFEKFKPWRAYAAMHFSALKTETNE